MSITIEPSVHHLPSTYAVVCHASNEPVRVQPEMPTYEEALPVRAAHLAACEECAMYGSFVQAQPVGLDKVPSVNMSNYNASVVLEALGLQADEDGQWFGSMDATAFLGRIVLALGLAPQDAGTPTTVGTVMGLQATICGRPEGYLQHRLGGLYEVAQWAINAEVEVQWG